ncbi:hypothetical protein SDRG_15799, partial [Saprolegnia diclina VS20]
VEAKYKGKTYYPGKIARCHADGTFDVDYDDGEKEKRVDRDLIRIKGGSPKKPSSSSGWVVGAKVEAKYKGKSKFYPGTIAKVHTDASFDIDYDDGEKEKRVEKDLIRLVEPQDTAGFRVGSKVEARYNGKLKYYPGKIARCHANGTYDIDYDDGEVETRVDKALIRAAEVSAVLKVGQKVQAKYKGKAKLYPGKITK